MGYKIAILGPECTGKTTLASQLAIHYKSPWVPEYARFYIEQLQRPYIYEDIEKIAKTQISAFKSAENQSVRFVFFDTELIITKVWFDEVFHRRPHWLENEIQNLRFDLYLLTDTSIPWQPDSVRENGGARREELFAIYEMHLKNYNLPYQVITGLQEQRLDNAIGIIDKYFLL
jgi:NadR type nicotinamide-nucleotide adenylyltransferase